MNRVILSGQPLSRSAVTILELSFPGGDSIEHFRTSQNADNPAN